VGPSLDRLPVLAACARALLAAGDDGAAALRRLSQYYTPWLFRIAVSRVAGAVSVVLAVDVMCILLHAHPLSSSIAATMILETLEMCDNLHDELQESAPSRALLSCCLLWSVRKQADELACARNRDELINAGLRVALQSLKQLGTQHLASASLPGMQHCRHKRTPQFQLYALSCALCSPSQMCNSH
jgi:hypothetical protein